MKCEQAQKLIDASVDGELTTPFRGPFESHLKACATCQTELARASRADAISRQLADVSAPDLRARTFDALANLEPSRIGPLKEIMKTTLGIRLGLTTALAAGALAIAFVPRMASANSGRELWAKMAKSAASIHAVHITNVWKSDGKKGQTEIWTDGHSIRMDEADGAIRFSKDGKFYETRRNPDGGQGEAVASAASIDPAIFTLPVQMKMLSAGASEPLDFGTTRLNGVSYRKVGIVGRSENERYTFWIDPNTNLPAKKVDETLRNGQWVEIGYQTFEFLEGLDPALFNVKATLVSDKPSGSGLKVSGGG